MKNHIGKILIVCLLLVMLLPILPATQSKHSEDYIRDRAVKLLSKEGQCSGEQVRTVSGNDYILSAGHCRPLQTEDGYIMVQLENGNSMYRKVIAEDPASDLLLIEGIPSLQGLDIAEDVKPKQHVRTFTHGKGMDTYKTEGFIIQNKNVNIPIAEASQCPHMPKFKIMEVMTVFGPYNVCTMSIEEMVATAAIVPGSSGGMVVDDEGDLVAVASATDEAFSYFVKLSDIQAFLSGY